MGENERTIKTRKELAKDHVRRHWKRGMKQREARALLQSHAKDLSFPNMYDCVFDDDPDFLGDMLAAVAEEGSQSAPTGGSVASLCEPLTAAALEENERSLRDEHDSVRGSDPPQQQAKSSRNGEEPVDAPSYDDDEADQPYTIIFVHPESGKWRSLTARKCRGKESFISVEAVGRCHLSSCTKTIRGVQTVILECRPCNLGTESEKTFVPLFRIIESEQVRNDVAVGSDAWKEVITPPHSDSGFNESESAESIRVAGYENRAPPPHFDNCQIDITARLGRLVQDAAFIGASAGHLLSSNHAAATGSSSMQLPSRSRSHRRKGS